MYRIVGVFSFLLLCGFLITSESHAETIQMTFIDEAGLLELDNNFYRKARATKPDRFVCMGYNFSFADYYFKEINDYFPFNWNESQNRLSGKVNIQHNLYRKYCKFETDIMYLRVWWPIQTSEPHNSQSAIAVVEDGDSREVTVHCGYKRSPTGYLHFDCDNAHVLPLEHNQTVTIAIALDEFEIEH